MQKDENKIILILSTILFLIINIVTLKNGHNWGDDFSQYIMHSKNIVENKDYTQGFVLNYPSISPPIFPILLAPLIKIFGINFQILKIWNIIGWWLFSYFSFLIANKKLRNPHPILLFTFLLSSPYFFWFKQSILTDIPFSALITIALFSWLKYFEAKEKDKKVFYFIISSILMILAFLTRYIGIVLFLTIFLYLFFIKKERLKSFFILFILLITTFSLSYIQTSIAGYSQLTLYSYDIRSIIEMLFYAFTSFFILLFPNLKTLYTYIVPKLTPLIRISIIPITTIISTIFFIRIKNKKTDIIEMFFILYILSVIFSFQIDGPRYFIPILSILIIFIIKTLYKLLIKFPLNLSNQIISSFLIIFLFFNIACAPQNFSFNDDIIYLSETQELLKQMKTIIKKDEVFIATRPRTLSLLTGLQGAKLHYAPQYPLYFKNLIKKYNVKYFIRLSTVPQEFENLVETHNTEINFSKIWENQHYAIFKISGE